MEPLKKIQKFLKYWYLRYLLVTELYMVDTWEKIVVHITFFILFSLFWYFNYAVVLNGISGLKGAKYVGQIS